MRVSIWCIFDPPFNSNRNYNVLFKDEQGVDSASQITAFTDTWHWGEQAEHTYHALVTEGTDKVGVMIEALRTFIGANQMMAYLVMMTARLVELHRVLKPTGSLYLHCDPTASHYLKIILDTIFDVENFRADITWKRHSAHNDTKRTYASITDSILFYVKTDKAPFNVQYAAYDERYVENFFRYADENGRRYRTNSLKSPSPRPNLTYEYKGYPPPSTGWTCTHEKMEGYERQGRLEFPKDPKGRLRLRYYLDDMPGTIVSNLWDDIPTLSGAHTERLGYPTQKPLTLLERIIQASSNLGDTILDPFCGCGTAIAAAHALDRRWIGIDITHLSIALQKYRLEAMYPGITFEVIGEPTDIGSAHTLALADRYQFQFWALSLIRAKPLGGIAGGRDGVRGSDKGVDGSITFIDDPTGKSRRVIVQVKSGHVSSRDIRDLVGTLEREQASIGVFLTLEQATAPMRTEAHAAGYYHSVGWGKDYPRVQILTIEELLSPHNKTVQMPPPHGTFKQAPRARSAPRDTQATMRFEEEDGDG